MMNMGERISEEECNFLVEVNTIYSFNIHWQKAVQEADVDGDGSINFEEFVGMMKSAGHYSRVDGSWQGNQEK